MVTSSARQISALNVALEFSWLTTQIAKHAVAVDTLFPTNKINQNEGFHAPDYRGPSIGFPARLIAHQGFPVWLNHH